MGNPIECNSTAPTTPGVKGTNSDKSTAYSTGVRGEGMVGVIGVGILGGIVGQSQFPQANFVAVRGDGGGIPGLPGIPFPMFGVIGTSSAPGGVGLASHSTRRLRNLGQKLGLYTYWPLRKSDREFSCVFD